MAYYVYHLPISNRPNNKNVVNLERRVLIGEYRGIQQARMAAIRFIGKNRKHCKIMDYPIRSFDDLLHGVAMVRYNDGRRSYDDKAVAEAMTGWVFVYDKGPNLLEIRDYNGKVKYRAQRRAQRDCICRRGPFISPSRTVHTSSNGPNSQGPVNIPN